MTDARSPLRVQSGSWGRPFVGERCSGDLAWVFERPAGPRAVLIDAAGHGPRAHELAARMAELSCMQLSSGPASLVRALHEEIRGSAGASIVAVDIDVRAATFECVAVGGIHACWFSRVNAWLESQPGLLGQHLSTVRAMHHTLAPGDVLVLASDGVSRRALENLPPSALLAPPEVAAERIVREHGRAHDDATCLILTVQP